jgi:mevalonate kinase
MITASAPGKLILFGEHAVVYGHPCIVTAVDQRLYVSVKKNGVNVFHLEAPDLGLSAYSKTIDDLGKKELPKSVRFIEHLYKRFLQKYPQDRGIIVTTKSDFSSNFGFGSSSAVTVAFAKALTKLYGIDFNNQELFELCYQAVLDVQGVGSGFDLAAAIWGGTLYYVSPAKVVAPMAIDSIPLVVGYTGIKADTPTLIRMLQTKKIESPEVIDSIFAQIELITVQAKEAITNSDWQSVGQLMQQNQRLLKELQVSSVELDALITASQEAGSWGAKLSGAGGGDCMVAIVSPNTENEVKQAINYAKGEVMNVALHANGVRIEP